MNHRKQHNLLHSLSCCAILAFAGTAPSAAAQTITAADANPHAAKTSSEQTKLPTKAEVSGENRDSDDDKPLQLSPFTVTDEGSKGYQATSTLAGTRLRTDLRDVSSAVSIVTQQFLRDTGATKNEDLLVYTPSTEVGGLRGNYTGTGNGAVLRNDNLVSPNTNNRVRGLSAADTTRDYFLTDIPWDAYNIDHVELQRGPNAILFGLGKPGGVINGSQNQAGFKNLGSVEFRVDNNGSLRGSLDLNRVLIKDELSLRVDGLDDHTKYEQKPAYSHDRRAYAALRYDPAFLNKNTAHTSLRINYEKGKIDSNNPRTLPPLDEITPFFGAAGKKTYDFRYNASYSPNVPNSGATAAGSPNFNPAVGDQFGGLYAFFSDPNSGVQSGPLWVPYTALTEKGGLSANGSVDGNIGGLFGGARNIQILNTSAYAIAAGLPFAGDYKAKSLTDPSIFDFYHKLIDGPTKHEWRNFEAANMALSQTFWNNTVGLEVVLDKQRYEDGTDSLLNGGEVAINVDINTLLPNQTPNPNVGRPEIISRTIFGNGGQQTERTSYRLTGFAEFQADKFMKESWLTRLLGRHVFTGVLSGDKYDRANQTWARYALMSGSQVGLDRTLEFSREVQSVSYLAGSLANAASAHGLNLPGLNAYQTPNATSIVSFNSTWNRPTNPAAAGYVDPGAPWVNPFNNATSTQSENPDNYVGWTQTPVSILDSAKGDRRVLTNQAHKSRSEIKSEILVWQGYLMDRLIVPTFGWRRDTAKAYSAAAPINSDGWADQTSPTYNFADKPDSDVSGITKSYGVVLHTPKFIRTHLPAGLDFDLFYNQSSNFEPSAGVTDMLNKPMPPPTGKTKDYGIVVKMLDNRVSLKINRYESAAENAAVNWSSGFGVANLWLAGATECRAWVAAKRYQAGLSGDPRYAGYDWNIGTMVNGVFVQTAADRARQQTMVDNVLNNFAPEIWPAWTMEANDYRWQIGAFDPWGGGLAGYPPAGLSTLSDTSSKGYEMELNVVPVDGWDISINAAKNTAQRTNFAKNLVDWVEARNKVWNGPAGDIYTYGSHTVTIKDQWNQYFYNGYKLQTLLNGSDVPELRPWRFNLVTNYRFRNEKLKGLSVGGAYRWEDKVVIGYPSIHTALGDSYDITKPFMGPGETNLDLWTGYERKLTKKIAWSVQLNVRNVLGKNELVPINLQPDGSAGAFRIKEGPSWTITNRLNF